MSRDAPLASVSQALRRLLVERVSAWPTERRELLGAALLGHAAELSETLAIALSFPEDRGEALRLADHALVRLRRALDLAEDLGWISAGFARHAGRETTRLGKMLGGWRRRSPGGRSRARTASSAVGPSTTTPTGAGPRTATGGTPPTGTTTRASASSSPTQPRPG